MKLELIIRENSNAWVLALILSGGFSTACASHPSNFQKDLVASTEAQESQFSNKVLPTTVAESNNTVIPKPVSSGDQKQDLERSLQEFDEKLLRELEETQQEREENARQKASLQSDAELDAESESDGEGENGSEDNARSESESESESDGEGENGSEDNARSESDGTASESSQESSSDEQGASEESQVNSSDQSEVSNQQGEGSASSPRETIPSGDDDDVVARQLREAAEAEKNPNVKEKLWEEYRKYKNQQSVETAP